MGWAAIVFHLLAILASAKAWSIGTKPISADDQRSLLIYAVLAVVCFPLSAGLAIAWLLRA